MRIVLATTAATPGGVWKHMTDLARTLRASGDHIVLAVPAQATALTRDADALGFDVATLDDSAARAADVWHLHLPKPFDRRVLPLLVKARLRGRRTVVTEHLPRHPSSDPTLPWEPHIVPGRRKPGAYAGKTVLKQAESRAAHHVITVSESSRGFLIRRFGLGPRRCSAVVNGVSTFASTPLPSFDDGLRVVAIGTAGTRKGHDLIIEAARRSHRPWRADIYGDGLELDRMRQLAEPTNGRVVFHGWTDDPAAHIDSSHLICMPSRYEPLGYAAVEAMARSRPVIAAAVDGLLEVVDPEVTGRLVPPGDPAALAEALDFAATHHATVAGWARAAHERARNHFTLDAMAAAIRDIYGRGATGRQRTH